MRTVVILFILFFVPEYLISQRNYADSLYRIHYLGGNVSLKRYDKLNCHLKSIYDSSAPLNIIYIDRQSKVKKLQGCYEFTLSTNLKEGFPHYVGITPLYTYGFGSSLEFSLPMNIKVKGCFKNGIPSNHWEYEIAEISNNLNSSTYILKQEFYKNGLLEGDYVIRKKEKREGTVLLNEVIYQTTFQKGSGYYKDYFPDGTLRMEGALLNGYMDGQWVFYVYDENEYQGIIIEKYEKGHLTRIPQKLFSAKILSKSIRKTLD